MKFSNYNLTHLLGCHNYYYLSSIYEKKKLVNFNINNTSINDILFQMFDYEGNDKLDNKKLDINDYYNIVNEKMNSYLNNILNNVEHDKELEIRYQNTNFTCKIDSFYEDNDNVILFNNTCKKIASVKKSLTKAYDYIIDTNTLLKNPLKAMIIKNLKRYHNELINVYYYKFIYENSTIYNKFKHINYYLLLLDDEKQKEGFISLLNVTEIINNTYDYFINDINLLIKNSNELNITLESNCKNSSCKFYNICKNKIKEPEEEIIDREKLVEEFDKISYPIYYLDFESFSSPYPRFIGELPYSNFVFQYSLIIRKTKDSELIYKDYLASDNQTDIREDLFATLTNDIDLSNGGSVIVYNDTFEKTRIKEAITYFPHLKDKLTNINNHIIDLKKILKGKTNNSNYYNSLQKGSYSIKSILPIFSNETYEDIDIHKGTEASEIYANFHKFNKDELAKAKQDLITYCRKDTYSMYLIETKIKEKIDYKK